MFKFFKKNVVHQHNDLAPAAIEQQINNLNIHHAYRMIVHFKNVVRQHNDLAPAAIEQQINNLIIHHALRRDSFCERNV